MQPTDISTLLRVLLVEDSRLVRQRIRGLIEEAGPVEIVGETGSITEAMALYHTQAPDVVLLDLGLADGTGGEVLNEIKQSNSACVVIVLTSFAFPGCRDFCLRLGADYFFDKSREFERVPEVLAELRKARAGHVIGASGQ